MTDMYKRLGGHTPRHPSKARRAKRLRLIEMYPHKDAEWLSRQLGVLPSTVLKACKDYGLPIAGFDPKSASADLAIKEAEREERRARRKAKS